MAQNEKEVEDWGKEADENPSGCLVHVNGELIYVFVIPPKN